MKIHIYIAFYTAIYQLNFIFFVDPDVKDLTTLSTAALQSDSQRVQYVDLSGNFIFLFYVQQFLQIENHNFFLYLLIVPINYCS